MHHIPEITLNDGNTIPAIGFGTYPLRGTAGVAAMTTAIENGYRLIDSAFNYENEGAVGAAVRASGVARDALRICSKLPGRHQKFDEAYYTIEESLWRAGLDYYDLYLIHWPNPKQGLYVEAWKAMIKARENGLIRSIGVSNFLPEHLDKLKAETGIVPAINQVELHPRFPQAAQRAYDRSEGIVTESWSPLGRGTEIMNDPVIQEIARKHGKTGGQVLLRWHVELGAVPLPKAADPKRQIENISIFDFSLDNEDMVGIESLARTDGRLMDQDPAEYEEF